MRVSYHTCATGHGSPVASGIVPVVLLYSRPLCGLCDEARAVILGVRRRVPFELVEIDITGDDALELEFGLRIPVVLVDGVEFAEIRVDPARLEETLRS
jgi:hypothetical protein